MFGGPFGSMFGGDPFLNDPFSHMDRMMNSMLNDPFFANPLGMGLRQPPLQNYQHVQQPRGRQPVIEEVDDEVTIGATATARDQPIVEEPDDEGSPQDRAAQRQRRHSPQRSGSTHRAARPPPSMAVAPTLDPFGGLLGALVGGAGGLGAGSNGGSSFVFSSSSYSSMGPGGVTYQASSTTRVGPGGVRETQSVVRDGRSGTEAVTISRGLGDGRQRTLVRTRDALTGREEQQEDLQGIREYEADTFDEQWRQHAERNLPGGGSFGAASSRIGATGSSGSRSAGAQRPLALPSAPAAAAPRATYVPQAPSSAAAAAPAPGRSRHHSATNAQYLGSSASASAARPAAAAAPPPPAAAAASSRGAYAGSYTAGNTYGGAAPAGGRSASGSGGGGHGSRHHTHQSGSSRAAYGTGAAGGGHYGGQYSGQYNASGAAPQRQRH